MLIQLYAGVKDNTGIEIDVADVLKKFSSKALEKQIATLRQSIEKLAYLKSQAANDKDAYNTDAYKKLVANMEAAIAHEKQQLPAVTWSGTFAKRSIKGIREFSNLICLDIDKLQPALFTKLRKKLCEDPHTFICFTSPSGNGIKLIFKIPGKADDHKNYFLSIEDYFLKKYFIQIDESGKDVCRLCFLSHDVNLYVNDKCKVYDAPPNDQPPVKEKPFTPKEVKEFEASEDFYSIIHFTDKTSSYKNGNYNNYIYLFACNCNRKGFTEIDTLQFSLLQFINEMPAASITATVKSAYKHHTHEHAKYAKKVKLQPADLPPKNKDQVAGKKDAIHREPGGIGQQFKTAGEIPSSNGTSEKPIQFWKERTITKGRDKNKYTVTFYELLRVEFTDFLFQQGFHLIDTDEKGYQICHSNHGIIKPVDARIIKKQVFAWCKKTKLKDIEEMLRKGQKQFFAATEMDSLHTKEIQFKTDTEMESYFYFNNCWVTVTADAITTHDYAELNQSIWAGNKIKNDITVQQPKLFTQDADAILSPAVMDCEFAKFIYYCAYNPKNEDEKDFPQEIIMERFQCFCSAIGFLLDGYKHPAYRKGIFSLDHKVGERDEQNGRTGKSIIPKACDKLKVVSHINGKTYDTKYQFRNELITADAQIIDFNDMSRTFDPNDIFEIIADNYSVNRRHNGFLHFKYETSPKVYYSTNAIPKGAGSSYRGRMHIIEFSDYFTDEHTPFDEFGHGLLGVAWDKDEWNRFYNFMLFCVQQHKSEGLVAYPKSNFDARKMANEVNIEFIDFMDGDQFPRNQRVDKLKILEKFNVVYQQLYSKKLTPNFFYKWVKQYCTNNSLYFNPHKLGGYDKSNSTEYYTIATTADFKPIDNEPKLF